MTRVAIFECKPIGKAVATPKRYADIIAAPSKSKSCRTKPTLFAYAPEAEVYAGLTRTTSSWSASRVGICLPYTLSRVAPSERAETLQGKSGMLVVLLSGE
jgi:putative component of membrane protein insertase Oxa1/YidC/SpoIIIJ protein YidD